MTADAKTKLGARKSRGPLAWLARRKGRPPTFWRAEPAVRWPSYLKVVALVAVVSFLCVVTQLVLPLPRVPGLEGVAVVVEQSENPIVPPSVSEESFVGAFQRRKLFIPEVPVESRELSDVVINEMLSRMSITAIMRQGEDLIAWIDVREGARGTERGPSGSSKLVSVKAGDNIGEFKVESVATDGVDLSIKGFKARLTF